ncbi:chromate efflux transporter [Lysobacter sp. K5869]|uniref:chromate efflux transporter n=1 Tax=Lysobacter sp. K5869 TaxID=2820808 RepID=UPI002101356D|nr:chromate efflux transporter [Lysobacter sp. K5869]
MSATAPSSPPGTAREVFAAFARLGLTGFGGPIAHLAYFREEFVRRRGWLDDARYAQLLSLCQFLPGPASSQMGLAIGLLRAGWRGALAAFVAFTLPSALAMFAFAALAPRLNQGLGAAAVHGLKLVAVVVVAHGLLGMARRLTPDWPRAALALAAAALVSLSGSAWAQLLAIAAGGVLGRWLCRSARTETASGFALPYGRRAALAFAAAFALGLALALLWPQSASATPTALAAAFYRAGALVFGGGHVVLPLLQQAVVDSGWIGADRFLAGYGAAQAMPGPMFSLAAFLGAETPLAAPAAVGAAIALAALFLPGFLILLAALPAWKTLAGRPAAASAMAGVNAAVVGLLAAALWSICGAGVRGWSDTAIVAVGFALLAVARLSALWIVLWCLLAAVAASLLG